ncbi:hypothetical protein LTR09_012778 [Extremus antarcticus]|uniref:Uncharacterized protein n=1 Tax=Extremus antarcticus TaxID=702011 RepID=A0AAJ0D9Q8_9PEZI|nr:hypothetical protein LTR09_012778 [Extremus antarcticus]
MTEDFDRDCILEEDDSSEWKEGNTSESQGERDPAERAPYSWTTNALVTKSARPCSGRIKLQHPALRGVVVARASTFSAPGPPPNRPLPPLPPGKPRSR